MSGERVYLFDTTLRDGAQTRGVDFSVSEKIQIATALDELGLDYVEGGWPGANPSDDAFFCRATPAKDGTVDGLRHDPTPGTQCRERSGPAGGHAGTDAGDLSGR